MTAKESELHNYTIKKLLSFTPNVNNISLEIKALQRSIAVLKQDLPKYYVMNFLA